MPVPARDGSWVVDGWGASRYEPGATACRDLDVTLAAGRLLHAQLAVAVPERPPGLDGRADRWAEPSGWPSARRDLPPAGAPPPSYAGRAAARRRDLGPDQLVHADLAGNVLLDARGRPWSSTSRRPGARCGGPRPCACSTPCCGYDADRAALRGWRTAPGSRRCCARSLAPAGRRRRADGYGDGARARRLDVEPAAGRAARTAALVQPPGSPSRSKRRGELDLVAAPRRARRARSSARRGRACTSAAGCAGARCGRRSRRRRTAYAA